MSIEEKKVTSTTLYEEELVLSVNRNYISLGADDFHDKLDVEKYGETKRKLNSRHVSLMIIGSLLALASTLV